MADHSEVQTSWILRMNSSILNCSGCVCWTGMGICSNPIAIQLNYTSLAHPALQKKLELTLGSYAVRGVLFSQPQIVVEESQRGYVQQEGRCERSACLLGWQWLRPTPMQRLRLEPWSKHVQTETRSVSRADRNRFGEGCTENRVQSRLMFRDCWDCCIVLPGCRGHYFQYFKPH